MKEDIKIFMNVQPNSKVTVKKIISYKVSPFDDEHGFIGENFIVKFDGYLTSENKSTTGMSSTSYVEYENSTAYINIREFKRWLQKENAVQYEFD